MDMMKFVGEGGRKLPPGFRFQPTDEEIVFQYLARKTFSHPLPAHILIPEINIFTLNPFEFPGNSDEERYFFSNKEGNNRKGNTVQSSKATCTGYWKATGSAKRINCSKKAMPIIGIRKSLVFYKTKKNSNRAFRTNWTMHEYFIAVSENYSIQHKNNSLQAGTLARIGNWTLCRIFLKKRRRNSVAASEDYDSDYYKHRNIDLNMSDTDSSSASSSSSPHSDDH
ncbi:hypothetical protein ABFS82_04G121500 [Erythranthe guttata]|uniref:NAC domain-containing protein n=1 Tax=Erythranthe guttata TaxID=4155 RepID=A0A022RTI2_ERYGU|nr:PREDICTED: NAC transcription factor 29-like [Erythranthe guttata]EYU43023.1 hypothetical protein MIMGU_mgv1a024673mg [Erythranthe guttata]|eukprot:XP_012830545.1 PREDICTED: NAC transcription factor 29-like [Erythranthe guttata]